MIPLVAAQTGFTALILLALAMVAGLAVGRFLSRAIARSREARAKEAAKARREAAKSAKKSPVKKGSVAPRRAPGSDERKKQDETRD